MSEQSILDTITRIYKNASNQVIGIHSISVHQKKEALPHPVINTYPSLRERRKRGVELRSSFYRLNLNMGGNRTIAQVQMIGQYDDFTMNGSDTDILTTTYNGNSDEENYLIISFTEFPTIGDVL